MTYVNQFTEQINQRKADMEPLILELISSVKAKHNLKSIAEVHQMILKEVVNLEIDDPNFKTQNEILQLVKQLANNELLGAVTDPYNKNKELL